jgi:hypothetical protein
MIYPIDIVIEQEPFTSWNNDDKRVAHVVMIDFHMFNA